MPAAKYTEAQRAEALALYETDGPTAVTARFGIPKGTVAGWAKANGTRTVRTAKTTAATEAKQADDKSMRTLIASDALSVVQSVSRILAERLLNPDEIPTRDLVTMYGVLTDKHIAIAKLDADNSESAAAVDQWLEMMTGGLRGSPTVGGESPPGTG